MKRGDVLAFIRSHPACTVHDVARALGSTSRAVSIAVCKLRASGDLDPAYALVPWDASAMVTDGRAALGPVTYGVYAFAADIGGTADDYADALGVDRYSVTRSIVLLRSRGAILRDDVLLTTEDAARIRDAAWEAIREHERSARLAAK